MNDCLDPQLQSNQRYIESLERWRQTEQLWQKLSPWKMWPVLLFSVLLILLIAFGLVEALGLDDRWIGIICMMLHVGIFHFFLRFLHKGWFRWLMRE